MNTRVTPARLAFSTKFGILWQSVSTCTIRPSGILSFSRNSVSRSKIDSPLLVARKIVVGDEKFANALRPVEAHQLLHILSRAIPRLATLHIDDGAERALVGAAAAGVETGAQAERAFDVPLGEKRHGRALTPLGVRAASRGAWTGATIAMPDGLTGAVTNGAAPPEPLSRRRSPRAASEVRI